MQLTGPTTNFSNPPSVLVRLNTTETKKRALDPAMPQLTTLESEPKKRRFTIIIKTPLTIDAQNGSTALHTALQEGQYDQAVALIKRHSRLNVAEKNTGWTPLHCLFCCSW